MSQGLQAYQEFGESCLEDATADAQARDAQQLPPPGFEVMCEDLDLFCEKHIDLASRAAVERKRQMQRRLSFVQQVWNDANRFERVITSGRYLKLCNLTEWISDCDERAWARVKNEILVARQNA